MCLHVCECIGFVWFCVYWISIICKCPDQLHHTLLLYRRKTENTKSKFTRRRDAMNFKYDLCTWRSNNETLMVLYIYHVWLIECSRNPWIFDSSLLCGVWEFGCCTAFSYHSQPNRLPPLLYVDMLLDSATVCSIQQVYSYNKWRHRDSYYRIILLCVCEYSEFVVDTLRPAFKWNWANPPANKSSLFALLSMAKKNGMAESMHAWPLLSYSPYTSRTCAAVGVCECECILFCAVHILCQ